ncbi:hypothetical protein M0R45_006077 [Rubus argutus]|uniref:Uncharacterized protein n=1 Tax=Rubus argutus TaxID=59490 RepID=A0AAW1YPX2_RUBAR
MASLRLHRSLCCRSPVSADPSPHHHQLQSAASLPAVIPKACRSLDKAMALFEEFSSLNNKEDKAATVIPP